MSDRVAGNGSTIRYALQDGVAIITLHRPEKLNAFTVSMADELVAAIAEAGESDAVRALIITGAGRAFCAGADLSDAASSFLNPGQPDDVVTPDNAGRVSLALYSFPKPIIAAINGAAVGVGVTMTLPMDVRLASTEARFGFVFSRRGIVPEGCSTWFLPRLVGISQAVQWCCSGRVFDANEALQAGLVNAVLAPDQLLDSALAQAQTLMAQSSAVSVALTRQMLWRMLGAGHPMEAHRIESRALLEMGRREDAAEGVSSFMEKRPPAFTMRVSRDMPPVYPWWEEPGFDVDPKQR